MIMQAEIKIYMRFNRIDKINDKQYTRVNDMKIF